MKHSTKVTLVICLLAPLAAYAQEKGGWSGNTQCFIDGKWVTVKGDCPVQGSNNGGRREETPSPPPDPVVIEHNQALDLNNQGLAYYRARDWTKAIDRFKEALKHWPENSEIRTNLSNAENALSAEHRQDLNDLRNGLDQQERSDDIQGLRNDLDDQEKAEDLHSLRASLDDEEQQRGLAQSYVVAVCLAAYEATGACRGKTPAQATEMLAQMVLKQYFKGVEARYFRVLMPSSAPSVEQIQWLRKMELKAIDMVEAQMLEDLSRGRAFWWESEAEKQEKRAAIMADIRRATQEATAGTNWSHNWTDATPGHIFRPGEGLRLLRDISVSGWRSQ